MAELPAQMTAQQAIFTIARVNSLWTCFRHLLSKDLLDDSSFESAQRRISTFIERLSSSKQPLTFLEAKRELEELDDLLLASIKATEEGREILFKSITGESSDLA